MPIACRESGPIARGSGICPAQNQGEISGMLRAGIQLTFLVGTRVAKLVSPSSPCALRNEKIMIAKFKYRKIELTHIYGLNSMGRPVDLRTCGKGAPEWHLLSGPR